MRLSFNPKLSHKGIVLVSVPLAFELAFVTMLFFLLSRAEEQTALSERARRVTTEATEVAKLTYDACNALTCYSRAFDGGWGLRYQRVAAEMPQHLQTLNSLVQSKPAERKVADQFAKAANNQFASFERVKDCLDKKQRFQAILIADRYAGLDSDLNRIARELEKLNALVEKDKIKPEDEARSRQTIKLWLLAGVVFNVVLAAALVVYFNRGTLSRLGLLMDNTRRLARRQPLNPGLAGNDEIAELDRVFHEMAQALAESERLRQEFVAMVSHDLRTPLTSIQGTLTLLSNDVYGTLSQQGKMRVSNAGNSVRRLIKLINDILDIEKLGAGKLSMRLEDVPIASLVERSLESVQAFAEQQEITVTADAAEGQSHVDSDRIVQVLVNLLSNAIKFSPPGAIVTVQAMCLDGWVEFKVIDKGRGIPAQYRQLVFERFKQIEDSDQRKKGGSGLGLAICREIIEQHGGTIGVESEEGQGSTFWFRVPAVAANQSIEATSVAASS